MENNRNKEGIYIARCALGVSVKQLESSTELITKDFSSSFDVGNSTS